MAERGPFLVNQTRWSQAMQALAVTKGLDHVELSALLMAAVVLENDRPESKYLAGEALAWGQYLLAAQGAGIVGYVGLRNPAASGKIIVVEAAHLFKGSTDNATIQRYYTGLARGATLTARSTEQPRDTRLQPSGAFGTAAPNIAGQVVSGRSDTIVVAPFATGELCSANSGTATATASFLARLERPVVLAPDDTLLLWGSDAGGGTLANVAIQGSFYWRERTTEPTET
jgi:hypothetical protein